MYINSKFENEFGKLEVPDNSRVVVKDDTLEVYLKNKKGIEHLLMLEDSRGREYFDERGKTHRDEKDGPALMFLMPEKRLIYFRHGERHRLFGPACYIDSEWEYSLHGTYVSKEIWEESVKTRGGKLLKKPKIDLSLMKKKAAELSEEALKDKRIGEINFSLPEDLAEIKLATNPKNWRQHMPLERKGAWHVGGWYGDYELRLNCAPLDDTLRCYITISQEGEIVDGFLQVE
jgi:hypothetical protein